MMLTTQIVTAVLAAFLFGAVVFWIGYSVGKAQGMQKR
jgi:cell shape-determining protein MreD